MTPAVVLVEHLTKRYGRRRGVHDISFEAGAAEVLGLLGPNGSGKTTILRVLTGYLQPTAGRASVAGFDVVSQGLEARRRIGYVPEDAPLYPQMRVAEFLSFMGELKGLAGQALEEALDVSCGRLAIDDLRDVAIGKLSRGYRQRVMIAQALLNDPDLLILDEPTNGLDPHQIIEMRELIRTLARRHTIIVTSHILSEIERVASRVAILLDGRLLATRTLDQDGGPRLRLRVRGERPESIGATLGALPGVRRVSATGGGGGDVHEWEVEVDAPAVAEAVAAALGTAGFGLLEMTAETRPDLEQLFLDLTRQAAA